MARYPIGAIANVRLSAVPAFTIQRLGLCEYRETWQAMRDLTEARTPETPDEVWMLEHPPIYTLGQAGKPEHVLSPGGVPVVHVDRGGQVTYHGPGQLVVYVLLDLRRRGLGIRRLVEILEQSIIDLLADHGIDATRMSGAPGVYVGGRKLGALGLRVRRGCCYHGLALNVAMDLGPFRRINPCGYAGLDVTQLADLGIGWDVSEASEHLQGYLVSNLAARSNVRLVSAV